MFGLKRFKKEVKVQGMHCSHCAGAVEDAIKGIDGVKAVKADADRGTVTVISKVEIDDGLIADAVLQAGFEVVKE